MLAQGRMLIKRAAAGAIVKGVLLRRSSSVSCASRLEICERAKTFSCHGSLVERNLEHLNERNDEDTADSSSKHRYVRPFDIADCACRGCGFGRGGQDRLPGGP
jgi:hypothetical protein